MGYSGLEDRLQHLGSEALKIQGRGFVSPPLYIKLDAATESGVKTMWIVSGTGLVMTEGDYGVDLPVKLTGATLGENDSLMFTFKTGVNGTVVLEKEYSYEDIEDNVILLNLTEADSELFEAGRTYVYTLDWLQDDVFLCNIIPRGTLKVVDKA